MADAGRRIGGHGALRRRADLGAPDRADRAARTAGLGIAVGIAVLGAVFTRHAGGGLPGLVDGLNAVFTVAAAIAAAGAAIAWPLLAGFRVQPSQPASSSSASGST